MEAILTEVFKHAPLVSVIIGVVLVVLGAIGVLPYQGERFPIETAWRYVLAGLGLVLVGVGTWGWLRRISEKGGTIKIDLTQIRGAGAGTLTYTYNKLTTVDALLDKIYQDLAPDVPPHSYGERWILRNRDSGKQFRQIGTRWATEEGLPKEPGQLAPVDNRVLKKAGIDPGMTLVVDPLAEGRKKA